MKLLSFQVKHYKSIDDSGECVLASDVTVLAGKNEAGKSNLLQALDKFNSDKKFDITDNPLEKEGTPEITLRFKLSIEELEEWLTKLEISTGINKDKVAEIPVVVTKKADNTYVFDSPSGSFTDLLKDGEDNLKKVSDEKDSAFLKLTDYVDDRGLIVPSLTPELEVTTILLEGISTEVVSTFPSIPPEDQEELKVLLEDTKSKVLAYEQLSSSTSSNRKSFLDSLPRLVFFDSFDQEELLPYEPTFEEARKNKAVQNYCLIAGLNLQEVVDTTDTQLRRKLVGDKATVIQGDFGEYWLQDEIDLFVSTSGDGLIFGIKEKGKTYEFKAQQRSKGLQWFLSFYLLLKAEASNKQNIIIVDEPGLYVHAKAQNDILRVLTDLSKNNQIIFSTHSPYLIDPTRLDRIRLVIKNLTRKIDKKEVVESGSKVFELSSVHTADKDTLTPIITAIGLDISKQLTFAADNNIVLEGISDYNFIMGGLGMLSKTDQEKFKDIHLIPCQGADNIPMVISLLIGWGLSYKILLDNDDKGKVVASSLTEKLQVEPQKIVLVSSTDNYCIEDLFSKSDFNKYVLDKPETYESSKLNSQVIPSGKKAILSREFLNKVRGGTVKLSPETKKNIKSVLNNFLV